MLESMLDSLVPVSRGSFLCLNVDSLLTICRVTMLLALDVFAPRLGSSTVLIGKFGKKPQHAGTAERFIIALVSVAVR